MKGVSRGVLALSTSILLLSFHDGVNLSAAASGISGSSVYRAVDDRQSDLLEARLTRVQALMPQNTTPLKARLDAAISRSLSSDISAEECQVTDLGKWQEAQLAKLSPLEYQILAALGAYNLSSYDAMLYGTSEDPIYSMGYYEKSLTNALSKLTKFWGPTAAQTELIGVDGRVLVEPTRTARVYKVVYGLSDRDAYEVAQILADTIKSNPELQSGKNPLFSMNSVSYVGEADGGPPGSKPLIVMGTGFLTAYRELNFGDVAPQAILAHEYAHQLQFKYRMEDSSTYPTPEATRELELHADALAAYFLSHPRGLSMRHKRITDILLVFANIGDCAFNSLNHHGTPQQRTRAIEWAYTMEGRSRPRGHILDFATLLREFETQLPRILVSANAR